MPNLFTIPNNTKPFFQVDAAKNPLTEQEVQKFIQWLRAQLKEVCGNTLQRSGTHAQAVSFFGAKANKVLHGIVEELLNTLRNETSYVTAAISQITTAIDQLYATHAADFSKPLSNIVFALNTKIGPMLRDAIETAPESAPAQQLSY